MKNIVCKIVAILALGALASHVSAQGLYKWVDKDGRVTYSDTPPPKDAKKVENKRMGNNVIEQDKMPYELKQVVTASPITLYTNDCDPCKDARAFLANRGVPFTEKNVDKDPEALKVLKDTLKSQTVPTLTVGSGTQKGFSDQAWSEAIDAAGYPKNIPKAVLRNAMPKPETPKAEPSKAEPPKAEPAKAEPAKPATAK